LGVAGCRLQVAGCRLQVAGCRLQVAGCRLQVAGCRLQVAGWGLWEAIPWLWKTLSSVSALVAISLPILNYQKLIEQMASLAGKWGELRIEYEDLWLQVKNADAPLSLERAYKKFRKIESGLQEKETKLPDDKKLLLICFNEVKQARGIN
jgi:hypothetical protein